MTDVSPEEIERRERYWFDHWEDFTCEVVVSAPVNRSIRAGVIVDSFFGSIPIPFHGQEIDRGAFYIQGSTILVMGKWSTFSWPLPTTMICLLADGAGVELRQENRPVYTIRGPVRAALAGACAAHNMRLQRQC